MLQVLVVEAEEDVSGSMARFFRARGLSVDTAARVEEACALSAGRKYDVVLAGPGQSKAPEEQNLNPLSWVRDHTPWARSVLLTNRTSGIEEAEARRRGADLVAEAALPLGSLFDAIVALAEEKR